MTKRHARRHRSRESRDLQYRISDPAGNQLVEHLDTFRTPLVRPLGVSKGEFFSWGKTGHLHYTIAQKIADQIKVAGIH